VSSLRTLRERGNVIAMPAGGASPVERVELELLFEGIYRQYGYDFRSYALSSLRRRVMKRLEAEGLDTVSALQERVLHDEQAMARLLRDLSVSVTSMFRDPSFFRAFREKVVPTLRTYPFIRVWHAGCSSGEEVYSMAILLKEEGLYGRARIYATDINEHVLQQAKTGIFPLSEMKAYTANYHEAGGRRSFSEYYTAKYEAAIFDASLTEHVLFAQHDLVTDRSFAEFNVIVCRNVLIYFDRKLKEQVLTLFSDSLVRLGVLALGKKESLRFTDAEARYEEIDARDKLWRRVL
jgi:chemotaxis protein methyltransferase CheR